MFPYNGELFGNEKELSTHTCYSMDKPQKYYAKWNKPDTKIIFYLILFVWNVQKLSRDRK